MMNDVLRLLRDSGRTAKELTITPAQLAEILSMLEADTINTPTAKDLLERVEQTGRQPSQIVEEEGLAQVSDAGELEELAAQIIEANPEQVEVYRGGKQAILGWLVGQIMQATQGKANPQLARQTLKDMLDE